MAMQPLNPFLGGNTATGGATTPFNVVSTPQPANQVNPYANMGIFGNPTAQTQQTNVTTPLLGRQALAPTANLSLPNASLSAGQVAKPSSTAGSGGQTSTGAIGSVQSGTPSGTSSVPFQGNYTFDAKGNVTGMQASSSGGTSTPLTAPVQQTNQQIFTNPPPSYGGLVGQLANTAGQPSAAFMQAQQDAQTARDKLATYQANQAQALALNAQNPIGLQAQIARSEVLQELGSQQQQAYASQEQAALQAAGLATSQQQTQQTGLGAAAGYAAPQQATALGTYNPVTGQYNQYGGASGGGAATAGAVGTQMQQGAQVQTMVGQQAQAQALAKNLTDVITQAGINPADAGNSGVLSNYVNGALQWINTNTGNPQYQNFANLINEVSSRYASILNQSGGTPTDQSTLSHNIINALVGGQSIERVLSLLDKNATDSINALKGASGSNATTNAPATSFYSQNWFSQ